MKTHPILGQQPRADPGQILLDGVRHGLPGGVRSRKCRAHRSHPEAILRFGSVECKGVLEAVICFGGVTHTLKLYGGERGIRSHDSREVLEDGRFIGKMLHYLILAPVYMVSVDRACLRCAPKNRHQIDTKTNSGLGSRERFSSIARRNSTVRVLINFGTSYRPQF